MLRMTPGASWQMIAREGGERLWREEYRPRYGRTVEEWETKAVRDLPATRILLGVEKLLYAGAEYYTSVQAIIPSAYISEALSSWFYDRFVKRPGDPPPQTYLLGFDSAPIRAEKSLYDLATWCREHPALVAALLDTPSGGIPGLLETERPPAGVDGAVWREWRSRFRDHLDQYGHMIYDLDFAKPVPADDPAPTFDTLKYYLRGEGKDPHERQREAAARREEATKDTLARLDAARRKTFGGLLSWTQKYVPLREDALADVGLAWLLMRRMLFELDRRLAAASVIEKPDDVFWLEGDEPGCGRSSGRRQDGAGEPLRGRPRTKVRVAGAEARHSPATAPEGGEVPGDGLAALDAGEVGGTVRGHHRGRRGQLGSHHGAGSRAARSGGLWTDEAGRGAGGRDHHPAWTPLFAVASAVVTDVGGPLSHGSIVAREYGIPAVLGTGVATRRIKSGQTIRVDGDAGMVTLLDGTGVVGETIAGRPAPEAASGARNVGGARKIALSTLAAGAAVAAAVWWRRRGGVKRV